MAAAERGARLVAGKGRSADVASLLTLIAPRLGTAVLDPVLRSAAPPVLTEVGWSLIGTGACGVDEVDGEAWLVLAGHGDDPDPGYVLLTLDFADPPEAAARRIGDMSPGSATRTSAPYVLTAPAISVIRLRGGCLILSVSAEQPNIDVELDGRSLLALPVPDMWPSYHGVAFGRWSEASSLRVPGPARPPVPAPQLMVSRVPDVPSGVGLWSPPLHAIVPVPVRVAGQPVIAEVLIQAADGPHRLPAIAGSEVSCDCTGQAVAAGTAVTAQVSATFLDSGGQPLRTSEAEVPIVDPRPPAPPVPDPVLHFASRPDGSGMLTAPVPLIPGPQIAAYHVDVASEPDLTAVSGLGPPSSGDRDQRARWWLQQSPQELAPAFSRVTAQAVPVGLGQFQYQLSGDLAHLTAFRLVPVGDNGASPGSLDCPLIMFAVPRDVAPPAPILRLSRDTATPILEVRCGPGSVPAVRHRVRMLNVAGADPRTGRVTGEGVLTAGTGTVPVPSTQAFARVTLIAEVRGEQEAGQPPFSGRWSPPSNELTYIGVPEGPPGFVTGARLSGTAIELPIDPALAPAVLADYTAVVYRRDPASDTYVVWRGPLTLAAGLDDGTALPPGPAAVVIIDPIGRRGSPVPVAGVLEFVDWTAADDPGATGQLPVRPSVTGSGQLSATGQLHGHEVTLIGPLGTGGVVDGSFALFDADDFSPPLPASDEVYILGLAGHSFTLTFGAPVQDPVFHLASLGSVTPNFADGTRADGIYLQVGGLMPSGTQAGSLRLVE